MPASSRHPSGDGICATLSMGCGYHSLCKSFPASWSSSSLLSNVFRAQVSSGPYRCQRNLNLRSESCSCCLGLPRKLLKEICHVAAVFWLFERKSIAALVLRRRWLRFYGVRQARNFERAPDVPSIIALLPCLFKLPKKGL